MQFIRTYTGVILGLTSIVIVALGIGVAYLFSTLTETKRGALEHETTLSAELKEKEDLLAQRAARIVELETLLQQSSGENNDLSTTLQQEKEKNDAFESQIKKIGSTVGTLDKLAKTDKELLMKYSKVYFLNENYMPAKLVMIDKKYLYNEEIPKFIHAQVAPFLADMISDALNDGVKIWITSAFRSFDEQADLKGRYTVSYGTGANAFSADQGYSEHQLGTTLDLTTEGLGGGITGFETTPAYTWLGQNAHKYGFILSYPHNNTFYVYEPWHWRFVGTALATYMHENSLNFYDLDQRKIDTYLISLFD